MTLQPPWKLKLSGYEATSPTAAVPTEFLRLAHGVPLADHMGRTKTSKRILQRFFWPSMHVQRCRQLCCQECQKDSLKQNQRTPMIPLPVIGVPFQRITMAIVGPLPRSRSGKKYMLVICDYATRYPEAISLRSIDAETIAEELAKFFARVGIPQEILTDQGSNFTSRLLAEVFNLLQVTPIRTSPYHPQTDGLVERFNQTLKSMLRKTAREEGKVWIGWCPTFSLPTERSLKRPLDSLLLTCSMVVRYEGH